MIHLKDVRDDLTHEPGWVYLYGALLSGVDGSLRLFGGGFAR